MVRLAAAEVSFPKASALLEGLAGVQVETKQVERTAEALGREIEADERDVTEPGSCPAPTMYLGLDGTGVPDALLAKMDDDDLYGPEHLWDVALAREYSGAALVGKFPATVYLARGDRTVRRRRVPGETWSSAITGGTMLIGRADLERAGGWRRAARHVDAALVEDVRRGGGGVYRTHDAGYLMVRHGDRHTWEADDAEFLAGAEAVHAGWRPALAGIGDAPPRDGRDAGWGDA